MKSRDAILAAFFLAGFTIVVDVLQAVATPDSSARLTGWAVRLFRADVVKLFVMGLALAFFCTLLAAAVRIVAARRGRSESSDLQLLERAEWERKERERRLATSREPHITRNDTTGSRPAA